MRTAGDETPPGRVVSWLDIAIAFGTGLLQVGGTYLAARHQSGARSWDVLGVALLAAGPLALAVRRRWPLQVYAVAFVTTLAYQVIGYVSGPVWLGLIVAFATLIIAGRRRVALVSLVAGYVLAQWLPPLAGTGHAPGLAFSLAVAAWLLVLLAAAEGVRVRRVRAADAVRLRGEETRRQVSEERLRIARELHDVVAQNISLINVQAATTLFQLDGPDGPAAAALATIKQVSHETLLALRSVLGVLREGDMAAPRAPAPSLSRLDDLMGRIAGMGVTVHVEEHGIPRLLPAGVDLAAYRIVQEALTNVARHAGTATARVQVTYEETGLVVEVDDDGALRRPVAAGTGITGMTERAAGLGGELQAGPRPGGGFRVRARLPLDGTP